MFTKKRIISIIIVLFMLIGCQGNIKNIRKINSVTISIGEIKFLNYKKQYPWLNVEIYEIILYYCRYWEKNYKIDEKLVFALIQHESGSYCRNDLSKMTRVISRSGAIGICQIMPFHAKNPNDLCNPNFNIKKGIWYLSLCMKKSNGNIRNACRMYNAGLNNKIWKYKNWAYINRIEKDYKKSIDTNKNNQKLYVRL
jgi:soluble lytic murein transglycosylase-like protein